ncbi:Hin recombinase [Pseudosulfitobacter pseudonitzschiae]|nr:Hin recombinase [Pseudosulfitobacter pseudonitzschiae]
MGRPSTLSADEHALVRERIAGGEAVSSIARDMGTSRQTIMRARDSEPK